MSNSLSNPVPLGLAGTGNAVVLGPTPDGLGALRYLQRTDALRQTQQARAQAAAQKQLEASQKDLFASASKLNTSTGLVYGPLQQQGAQEDYQKMRAIAIDSKLSRAERNYQIQQIVDARNRMGEAGKVNDKFANDEIQRALTDKRLNAELVTKKLHDTFYRRAADGSLQLDDKGKPQVIPALEYDPRATAAALAEGNEHINTPALFEQFVNRLPDDEVTYSRQPQPGQQGFKRLAKSNVFELNEDGTIKLDPHTGNRVLKNTPEMLAAFQSDPLQKQWLDAEDRKHEQQLAGVIEKMKANEPLTEEEQHVVATEQSVEGRKMELVKRGLLRYGYARQETDLLTRAVPRPPAAKAPKFTRAGGLAFGPELMGGTAAGGTQGLLALASSDPLVRVKADGSHQPFTAKQTHRQYVLLQNGQPARLVTNNAEPQTLSYTKPQLYLTTPTGNVVTPTDPTLLARFQGGDKEPLLTWMRAQREAHPGYAVKWHFQATPATDKLTGQNQAQQIYQRLVTERNAAHLTTGQAGYHSDDELLSTAQKLASQQGATLLIPYTGSDMRDINRATDFMLKGPKYQKAMQDQLEYFNSQTAPRPAEQRATPKKSLGINFGTKASAPTAAPAAPAPAAPPIKRAGTKKTGINF